MKQYQLAFDHLGSNHSFPGNVFKKDNLDWNCEVTNCKQAVSKIVPMLWTNLSSAKLVMALTSVLLAGSGEILIQMFWCEQTKIFFRIS